jgi:hypothetical protein
MTSSWYSWWASARAQLHSVGRARYVRIGNVIYPLAWSPGRQDLEREGWLAWAAGVSVDQFLRRVA